MTTYNFCKKMDVQTKIAIDRWARRDPDVKELTIHKDGTVTMICEDGYICYHYRPTAKELYGKYKEVC